MIHRASGWFCLLSVILICPAVGALSFSSDEQFSDWLMNYHKEPHPEGALDAITYYTKSTLSDNETFRPLAVQFFSEIFVRNVSLFEDAYERYFIDQADEESQALILGIFWLTDSHEGRHFLQKVADRGISERLTDRAQSALRRPVKNLYGEHILFPDELDMLWMMFFASGDERPVKRIISTLEYLDSADMKLKILGEAARWSLTSNAEQHPRVREIIEDSVGLSDEAYRPLLERILFESIPVSAN